MTAFQRRHYEAIANVIKMFPVADRVMFVAALNDMFKADNDTYNKAKFTEACGLAAVVNHPRPKAGVPLKTLREKGLL